MNYESTGDLLLTCADCGSGFVLTVCEVQFFADRGLHRPRRCRPCRKARFARDGGGFPGPGASLPTYRPRD